MDFTPSVGLVVRQQSTGIIGVVTEVRPTGVDESWTLVEFRTGPGDDEVFCAPARDLRIYVTFVPPA